MSRLSVDRCVRLGLQAVSLIAVLIVGLIIAFLAFESRVAIESLGGRMFTDDSWHPQEFADSGSFGMLPMVVGTLLVSTGAILIAAPLGVASAVFSQFYAQHWIAFLYRRMVELLVGIPSVVYGFWGLVVLCPMLAKLMTVFGVVIPGPGLLTAIIIVAVMILPTVMLVSEAAIKSVPQSFIFGAVAAGMGRFTIVKSIVLPHAKTGILTGIVLALARAVGETMAVVMVAGNVAIFPDSMFAPVRTLTASIALEMGYAVGVQRSSLFFAGLLLLMMVAFLFAIEIFFRRVIWRRT